MNIAASSSSGTFRKAAKVAQKRQSMDKAREMLKQRKSELDNKRTISLASCVLLWLLLVVCTALLCDASWQLRYRCLRVFDLLSVSVSHTGGANMCSSRCRFRCIALVGQATQPTAAARLQCSCVGL